MFDMHSYLMALGAISLFAFAGWVVCTLRSNVTLVDSMWSLFFLLAAIVYSQQTEAVSERASVITLLVAIWALRLSIYLTCRNWGPHEDHRYQAIRKNNEPNFWIKSLYIVFGLQAVLAWIISLPLLGAIHGTKTITWLDFVGIALWVLGFLWESIGDWQLARFKAQASNKGKVMAKGLWRFSRHPNYFGEFCIWWAYGLLALAAGAWWSLPAPLLMTFMLLKVSGVALLEKDIGERRPAYADYIKRTNAFLPWLPKSK
ncbi:MAG: DUF1295 domain-containing protein [Methylophilaceae bacterium]|nr:DUF1295 domain-containing protein [Methyloradius sp.]